MAVDSKNRVMYAGLGNCYISEHFTRPDFDEVVREWTPCLSGSATS